MVEKIVKAIITSIGMALGFFIYSIFENLNVFEFTEISTIVVIIIFIFVSGIIFYFLSPKFIELAQYLAKKIENELQKFTIQSIAFSAIGLIIGLLIAYLLSQPLYMIKIPYVGLAGSVLLYIFFGYLGIRIPAKKIDDINASIRNMSQNRENIRKSTKDRSKSTKSTKSTPMILDTSVIIDGRIADIVKTGFIEGPLVIPEFVLEELQHIADSSDALKRNRGRRGLDILNRIQNELDTEIIIHDKKFEDIAEVDSKLLKLTQMLKGKIITNDYNLNKVAEVQRIEVLNINDLANALKPVVLPGEEMTVQVVRDGKEAGQGLAYLDDGTMIVIESGRKYIGEVIDVIVTSVLQTSAGRMIFAKPKG
jgi:uncharacterized protein YacL